MVPCFKISGTRNSNGNWNIKYFCACLLCVFLVNHLPFFTILLTGNFPKIFSSETVDRVSPVTRELVLGSKFPMNTFCHTLKEQESDCAKIFMFSLLVNISNAMF